MSIYLMKALFIFAKYLKQEANYQIRSKRDLK